MAGSLRHVAQPNPLLSNQRKALGSTALVLVLYFYITLNSSAAKSYFLQLSKLVLGIIGAPEHFLG